MDFYHVTVAHYGHPQLKGAWHYSILVYNQPTVMHPATAYQLKGGDQPRTFVYDGPEPVKPRESSAFRGEIVVGRIGANEQTLDHFSRIIRLVEITNGSHEWNCQSWVAECLTLMAGMGLAITPYSQQELVLAMAKAA
ncbi:hypothetical protein CPB86DRAFT_700413 [Serendipita vermifera]|nr:hypothetical protein CPB86DRAFT_700413 [Serendipita vermifera]